MKYAPLVLSMAFAVSPVSVRAQEAADVPTVELHGVAAAQWDATVSNPPDSRIGLRQLHLYVIPSFRNFEAFVALDFGTLAKGGKDPVMVAQLYWHVTKYLTLSAGRLFTPTDYGQQLPPHRVQTLLHPQPVIASPLIDYGAMATLHAGGLTFDAGMVQGDNRADQIPCADVFTRFEAEVIRHRLKIGAALQTGGRRPSSTRSEWRQGAQAYLALEFSQFLVETQFSYANEIVAEPDPRLRREAFGDWVLVLWQPMEWLDLYARGEVVYAGPDDEKQKILIGANLRPVTWTAFRIAYEQPLNKRVALPPSVHLAWQFVF